MASAQTMVVPPRRLILRFVVCIIVTGGMFRSLFMPCPLQLEMTRAGLGKGKEQIMNMTEPAQFPLLLSMQSNQGGKEMKEGKHIHLLESNGNFHEENCASWHHDGVFECKIEWDEWMLVNAFIQPGDVVIEFGARFGTTSCTISRQVGEFGHVISVEPDVSVHGYLLKNRYEHSCNYHAVLGVVSKEPIFMGNERYYAQMTKMDGKGPGLPSIDIPEIQNAIGSRINVALIDCEGCIPFVDKTDLLDEEKGVDLILMEEDAIDYSEWYVKLYQRNYKCVWYIRDTFVNKGGDKPEWSRKMRHSVWIHDRVFSDRKFSQSCKEYVESQNFTSQQIDCAECP